MTNDERMAWLIERVTYLEHDDNDGMAAHLQAPLCGAWPITQEDGGPDPRTLIAYIDDQLAKETPASIMAMPDEHLATVAMDHQVSRLRLLLTEMLGAAESVLMAWSGGPAAARMPVAMGNLERVKNRALDGIDAPVMSSAPVPQREYGSAPCNQPPADHPDGKPF